MSKPKYRVAKIASGCLVLTCSDLMNATLPSAKRESDSSGSSTERVFTKTKDEQQKPDRHQITSTNKSGKGKIAFFVNWFFWFSIFVVGINALN